MRRSLLVALLFVPLAAACGESLASRVTKAMDSCTAQRNPLFVAGKGGEAIALPLTSEVAALAGKFDYERAFRSFKSVAEKAATQAVLTCALEFASRYHSEESRAFVERYVGHASPDVAAAARGLMASAGRG